MRRKSIFIASPFINKRRSEAILEWLRPAKEAGVSIRVVTRPSETCRNEVTTLISETIALLRGFGIEVVERAAIHQKFVLIDARIVWYGSLNLLSYGASEESLMLLSSREVAEELMRTVI